MKTVRLGNPGAVRRMLASSLNDLLVNKISPEKSRAIGYLASVLLKSFEIDELDKRISEIEKQIKETVK